MKGIFGKVIDMIGFPIEEEEIEEEVTAKNNRSEKVVTIKDVKSKSQARFQSYDLIEYASFAPEKFEEVKYIAEEVIGHKIVNLNLTFLSKEEAQRTLDFLSGASLAIRSRIEKLGNGVFSIVPAKIRQNRSINLDDGGEIIADGKMKYNEEDEILRKAK